MKFFPLLLTLFCLNLPAFAADFGSAFGTDLDTPRLTVAVVGEKSSIAPGQPFTVGVKMKHIDHGHSYWINPGGPGSTTKFTWTLPDGFIAGAAQWPTPMVGDSASFLSYLYEGEIMPLVTITPPATAKAGTTVELAVQVNALVCVADSCQPQEAKGSLRVAVAETAVASDAAVQTLFLKAREALPVAPESWTFTAAAQKDSFVITLQPSVGANQKLQQAYFFSAVHPEQITDPAKPQVLAQVGDHWTLTVPRAEDNPKAEALRGNLQTSDGWLEGGKTNAFEVNLPLGNAKADSMGDAAASTGEEEYGTLTLLFFAFLGGLILNVMPCVFPVIGIKIMGFVQQAGEDKKKIVLHGLAYTAGVLVCFWALALFVIVAGKGWGSQLQSPWFVFGLCYFFLAFGLNMAGVFEFGTSVMGVGQDLQAKSGLGGSFFQGLLATVVATPCSAPFLAPALAWAVSLPPVMALAVFTVIGLGLALPYLVLSFSPGLVKLMPRPGAWMESFKQGMSFLLFGTAGYMLWVLTGMVEPWNGLMTILGAVLLALACWIYGRWFLPHKSARARGFGLVATALALAGGLWLGWPTDLKQSATEAAADGTRLKWQDWSPELVKELRAANKPVYIDFTARWCATCQVNKRLYKNDAIKALLKDKHVELLLADYTNYDDLILKTIKEEYRRVAVPVNVLYVPGSAKAIILPPALTEANLTEVLSLIK